MGWLVASTLLLATSATKWVRREREKKIKARRLKVAPARSGTTLACQSLPWKSSWLSRRRNRVTYWHAQTQRSSRWSIRSPSANSTDSANSRKFLSTSGMTGSVTNLRESYRIKEQRQVMSRVMRGWFRGTGQKTIFNRWIIGHWGCRRLVLQWAFYRHERENETSFWDSSGWNEIMRNLVVQKIY